MSDKLTKQVSRGSQRPFPPCSLCLCVSKLTKQIFQGSQRLALSVLLLSMPMNLALAQDFEKIAAKLKTSVAEGHLTEQQARAMMRTLRQSLDRDANAVPQADNSENHNAQLANAGSRIRKLFAAGEITAEEGRARLDQVREKLAATKQPASGAELEVFGVKLRQAVRNGRITAEDAQRRMAALRTQHATAPLDDRIDKTRLEQVAKRLEMAVKNGDLNEAEAREKFRAIKEQLRESSQQDGDRDVDDAKEQDDDPTQGH